MIVIIVLGDADGQRGLAHHALKRPLGATYCKQIDNSGQTS